MRETPKYHRLFAKHAHLGAWPPFWPLRIGVIFISTISPGCPTAALYRFKFVFAFRGLGDYSV